MSNPNHPPTEIKINTYNKSTVVSSLPVPLIPFARVIAAAFLNDVLSRYIHLSSQDLPNDTVVTVEKRMESSIERLQSRFDAGAEIVEVGGWGVVGSWFPPYFKLPEPDRATAADVLLEYYDKFAAIKKKWLGERQYWYLNLLGRDPNRKEPGLVRALMDPYLKRAQEEALPVWLEASNTHARDIYIHFGFREVERVALAVGKADRNGYRVEGGEGVIVYGLILEPKT